MSKKMKIINLDGKVAELQSNGSMQFGEGFIVSPRFSKEMICSVISSSGVSLETYAGDKKRVNIRSNGPYTLVDFAYLPTSGIIACIRKEMLAAMEDGRINIMRGSLSPDAYASAVNNGWHIYLKEENALILAMLHDGGRTANPMMSNLSTYGQTIFVPIGERDSAVDQAMKLASYKLCGHGVTMTSKGSSDLLGFINRYV
jgi:hypothetical protein